MDQKLSIRDIRLEWGVNERTIRQWIADRKLRVAGRLPGGQYRFNREDVEGLFSIQRKEPTS